MNKIHALLAIASTYLRPHYVWGVLKATFLDRSRITSFRADRYRVRCRPPSFVAQYRGIFLERAYDFPLDLDAPRILDLGANVGFSVLFFKKRYANASITAFEPDPELFSVLDYNCQRNRLKDVTLLNKAAWIEDTQLQFQPDGLGGGRLDANAANSKHPGKVVAVEAMDLKKWLHGRTFDLIKIDIEGAEGAVIRHCMEHFCSARFIAFEFHSTQGRPQELGTILSLLEAHGYRYHIRPDEGILAPFTKSKGPFDNQLFIVATRA